MLFPIKFLLVLVYLFYTACKFNNNTKQIHFRENILATQLQKNSLKDSFT